MIIVETIKGEYKPEDMTEAEILALKKSDPQAYEIIKKLNIK